MPTATKRRKAGRQSSKRRAMRMYVQASQGDWEMHDPSFSLGPTNLQLNSAVSIAANCESVRIIAFKFKPEMRLLRAFRGARATLPPRSSAAFLRATRINLSSILGDDAPIASRPRSPSISRGLASPSQPSLFFLQLSLFSLFFFSHCVLQKRRNGVPCVFNDY